MKNRFRGVLVYVFLVALSGCDNSEPSISKKCDFDRINELVWIPPTSELVTTERSTLHGYNGEGFFIQSHEVTVGQFNEFVAKTSYITDAENVDHNNPAIGGSAIFTTNDEDQTPGSWVLDQGANWKNQYSDSINQNLPVTHVSLNDAKAYAKWAGGRIPTEAEWEYAAQLGLRDATAPYSGAFDTTGTPIANTWQGFFPLFDKGEDGYKGVSPVACFESDRLGIHDMIGNVWEWTSTPYDLESNVIKGGSFLCSANYCRSYSPTARQYHEVNFSTNHIGFRIVVDSDK